MTAIAKALGAAASKDPRALAMCVEALGLALAEMMNEEDGEGRETG